MASPKDSLMREISMLDKPSLNLVVELMGDLDWGNRDLGPSEPEPPMSQTQLANLLRITLSRPRGANLPKVYGLFQQWYESLQDPRLPPLPAYEDVAPK